MAKLELKQPKFITDAEGKSIVVLDRQAYIALLVRGNITDPSLWPPGAEEGAKALARIREIEANCIAQHGIFDWEKLPPDLQDEYDTLCALLDRLMDTGERVPLEDLRAEVKGS